MSNIKDMHGGCWACRSEPDLNPEIKPNARRCRDALAGREQDYPDILLRSRDLAHTEKCRHSPSFRDAFLHI